MRRERAGTGVTCRCELQIDGAPTLKYPMDEKQARSARSLVTLHHIEHLYRIGGNISHIKPYQLADVISLVYRSAYSLFATLPIQREVLNL